MTGDDQDLGTQTSALQPAPGAPVPEWKDIWGLNDPAGGTASPTGDPTICSSAQRAFLTFTLDTSGYYKTYANVTGARSNWGQYGTTRTFGTKAACAMMPSPADLTHAKFLLIGRGLKNLQGQSDTKLYFSQGNWNATNPTVPTPDTPWTQLSPNGESYATNGSPAVAVSPTGKIVVTLLGTDNKVYAHYRDPGGNWSARIQGPALPRRMDGGGHACHRLGW